MARTPALWLVRCCAGDVPLVLSNHNVRFGQYAAAGTLVLLTLVKVMYPAPMSILFLGAVLGALNALIAMGIVLVYRANRVINFAQGELGAIAGLLGILLISGNNWPYVPAFALGLIAAIVTGALVEFLFVRRLARAPRLILTVATIGIAQLLAGGELALPSLFGTKLAPQDFKTPLDFTFNWHPVVFTGDHLIAIVVVAIAGVGLGGFLRYARLGVAIRATAESGERAAQLGIPVRRIGTVVWMIAAALSAAAFLLRAPIVGVPIGVVLGPALLLRALAAAVIGRMENLPVTFAAAVGLGMIEQSVFWSTGRSVVTDAVLFFAIVGALLLQRSRRVARGEADTLELVREVRPVPRELASRLDVKAVLRGAALAVSALLLIAPFFMDNGHVSLLGTGVVLAIVGASLVVLTGWAGEISLGQMAFFGFGAATAARLASLGWNMLLIFPVAGAVGAVAAILIGIPALRIRGPFLAVSTFAFALATSSFFLNREYFEWFIVDDRVVRPTILGVDLEAERSFYVVLLVVLALVLASLTSFRRSRNGRVLLMTRDNPRAAQAFGVDVTRARLMAFALSGFIAALGGATFAFHQHVIGQSSFTPEQSIRIFSLVVFGGLGSLPGVLAGSAWFTGIDFFVHLPQLRFLVSGVGLLVVLLLVPGGLAQLVYGVRDSFLRRVARRHSIVVPSLVGESDDDAPAAEGARATPSALAGEIALDVRGVEVAYGHTQVLFGVDLAIARGEIVALVGTNGAGKSTLLKAICGSVAPRAGSIRFGDVELSGARAENVAAQGIALVPGGKGVFPTLTVDEHLGLAAWVHGRDHAKADAAIARAIARFPVLENRRDQAAGTLSGGEQQMLTIATALVAEPTLLLIDELSLGLAPRIVDELLTAVRGIAADGTTIVLVEQSINVALTVAQRAVFMEKGTVRFDGPTKELLRRPDLARSVFLGAAPVGPARARAREVVVTGSTGPALEARDLRIAFGGIHAVDGVDLAVAPGQVLGIIGANGAGKTTLFDLLSGFLTPDEGEVLLRDDDVTELAPDARARLGLGRSFQDARLFPSLTVRENIAGAVERHVHSRDPISALLHLPHQQRSERIVRERVDELLGELRLQDAADKFVSELSTGSRRVVDLACCLAHEPSVLLLDEPSSGIAQREAEALAPVLLDIRARTGAALIVIEHDLPLLTAVSDTFVALELGRVIAQGHPADVLRDPAVVASYLGDGGVAAKRSGASGRKSRPSARSKVTL